MYCTVMYSTVLHSTVLYCNLLYCTVLYCTVMYSTVLYSTVLYFNVLYCTVMYCTVLYCTVLYCIVLHCTVLYSWWWLRFSGYMQLLILHKINLSLLWIYCTSLLVISQRKRRYVISGFHFEVHEKCALLRCYAASSGNSLPTFRDNLSIPFSGAKNPKII
jgi:hypothetical protein